MPIDIRLKPTVILISLSVMSLSTPAYSAGFALIENSASGMGKAFAGAAAVADDASTVWFNPAGMTYLGKSLGDKSQVTLAGHIVSAKTKFTDKGSTIPAALGGSATSGENASERVTSLIPNLYYVKPINEKLHFGLGVNAPFGSKTVYDDDWVGRYQAIETELLSINVNPSLSWKASEKLSLGGGVSAQYVDLKNLSSAIDSVGACFNVAAGVGALAGAAAGAAIQGQCAATYTVPAQTATDSHTVIKGDSIAFGFNLGLLYEATDKTRVGLSYRSEIKHDVDGTIKFDLDPGLLPIIAATGTTSFNNRDVKATVDLPPSVSLSVAHKVNEKLELLGDVTWTGWDSFEELRITETDGVTDVTVVPEKWEDVYRVSVGANYKYNDKLTLRTGVAFDEEPIPSATFRTPRIPGNDRTWLSFGAGYKVNKKLDLDFGYSHLFLDKTPIDNPGDGYSVVGNYDTSIDILSAQLNYSF